MTRPPRKCTNCARTESGRWFKGPDGERSLCHSCGLKKAHADSKKRKLQLAHDEDTGEVEVVDTTEDSSDSDDQPKQKIETPSAPRRHVTSTPALQASSSSASPKESKPVVLKVGPALAKLLKSDRSRQGLPQPAVQATNKRPADEDLLQEDPKAPRLSLEATSADRLQPSSDPPTHDNESRAPETSASLEATTSENEECQYPASLLQRMTSEAKRAQRSMRTIDADMHKLTHWVEEKSKATMADSEKQITKLRADLRNLMAVNARLKEEAAEGDKEYAALKTQLDERNRLGGILIHHLEDINAHLRSDNRSQQDELVQLKAKEEKMRGLLG